MVDRWSQIYASTNALASALAAVKVACECASKKGILEVNTKTDEPYFLTAHRLHHKGQHCH